MLKFLLILLPVGAAYLWRPSGPAWLQAVPDWVFWLLLAFPALLAIYRIIRGSIADLSD
ncbi:hypothetical protein ACFOD4_06230 [Pseudoroseomonas globiformis]|uniref:Uncharacterized protein n=1 Tax=Teichococcus globiformis TaxID=2307229 RepID=A0ABV7FZF9_9PROT